MITKPSPQEKVQSIQDTIPVLAQYLMSIGKVSSLDALTKDEVCGLIRACQEGVQKSLKSQLGSVLEDEIPF